MQVFATRAASIPVVTAMSDVHDKQRIAARADSNLGRYCSKLNQSYTPCVALLRYANTSPTIVRFQRLPHARIAIFANICVYLYVDVCG